MNAITTILIKLPALKSSDDFASALTDLETEHAEAKAAVADLEQKREATIFDGGNLAALEADIGAAEGRVKTLAVAIEGAERRRTEAIEAERNAELVAKAAVARKLNTKLTAALIGFAASAETLAGHAGEIKELREQIHSANNHVREAGRSDLVIVDPIKGLPEIAGRLVTDPMSGLNIAEFWPPHPDGAALLALTK